jgi:hypothetical protein
VADRAWRTLREKVEYLAATWKGKPGLEMAGRELELSLERYPDAAESRSAALEEALRGLAERWEAEASRFAIVARDSTIPQARDAALRLMQSRTEHDEALRAALASSGTGTDSSSKEG